MLSIFEVLNMVPKLNQENLPFYYYCDPQNASIIGIWKWQDGRFFNLNGVSDEVKMYKFIVTLDPKGKWHERSNEIKSQSSINLKDHKISVGSECFSGVSSGKQLEFGFGKDRLTGQTGAIGFSSDTNFIKKPLRDLLKYCGYRKALF